MKPKRHKEHPKARKVGFRTLLGVDVGGTFTDAVLTAGGRVFTAKQPTTPADQSQAVMAAVHEVLENAGLPPTDVDYLAHGMTVGTNALLEGRGARTALLTTRGFEDVLEIGRQARPDLYRLCTSPPPPLVPRKLRFGVDERISATGMIRQLDENTARTTCERIHDQGAESLAICLLFAFRDASHERRVAEIAGSILGDTHISCSHEVLNVFREYERCSTTVVDAYLSPLLGRYLNQLIGRSKGAGLPSPVIMQSSGGVVPASLAAEHAAWTVLSGPAGGAVGAAHLGSESGFPDVIGLDMGGTSCDVCVVDGGRVRQAGERTVAGRVLQLPMVDIHTVGAGGGSIGWRDAGGALRVGPLSAGADPGPACYGRGGSDPTVTDANLLLGYLATDSLLAGGIGLDAGAAEEVVGRLGLDLGLTLEQTAAGIVRVANQEMVRALRVVTVERGVDPRGYALLAFGGAGPMHALSLADELGIQTVLCPRTSGVLSALGLVVSDRRRDLARSVMLSGSGLTREAIREVVEKLAATGMKELGEGEVHARYDMRYRGQAFEFSIEGDPDPDPDELAHLFAKAHSERYGYADPQSEIELVNVGVAVVQPGATLESTAGSDSYLPRYSERRTFMGGRWLNAKVTRGELPAGTGVEGPAICEFPDATVVVTPGWSGEVDEQGTVVLKRTGKLDPAQPAEDRR